MQSDDLNITLRPNGYEIFGKSFAFTDESTKQQAFLNAQAFGRERLAEVQKQAGRPINFREKITGYLYTPEAPSPCDTTNPIQNPYEEQLNHWRRKPVFTPAESTRKQNRIEMYQRLAAEHSVTTKKPEVESNS